MKTKILILLNILFLLSSCSKSYNGHPEDLGKSVFNCLKDSDLKSFLDLTPDEDDIKAFLKNMSKKDNDRKQFNPDEFKELNNEVSMFNDLFRDNFDGLMDAPVDYSKLKIKDIKKKKKPFRALSRDLTSREDHSSIIVDLTDGKKNYQLYFPNLIKARGWVMVEEIVFTDANGLEYY